MADKNKTLLISIGVIAVLIIIGWITVFNVQDKEDEIIKIGVIIPLSGSGASYGEGWQKGVELAKEKIELEFGENVIQIIYEDSQFDSTEATKVAQKLINVNDVKAIILGSSSETLAVAPIAENNHVLLMTGGTSADITNAGDYVFRIYPSDLYQGKDLAKVVIDKGYTKVAVLTVQDDYGVGLTNVFQNEIKGMGGDVLAIENFIPEGTTDFKTQLNKISAKNPDSLLVIGHENHYPLILKQIKELNIKLPLFASESFQSQSILDATGNLANGVIFPNFVESKTEEHQTYVSKHQREYFSEPFAFSAGFYDNVLLVSEALINNKGDVAKAKAWLYNLKDWEGATGITNYDSKGDTVGKSYAIMIVENGKFKVHEK